MELALLRWKIMSLYDCIHALWHLMCLWTTRSYVINNLSLFIRCPLNLFIHIWTLKQGNYFRVNVTDTYWKILYNSNCYIIDNFFKLIITKRSVLSCLLAYGCQLFWSSLRFTYFKGMFLSRKFHIFFNTRISGVGCSVLTGDSMCVWSHKSLRRLCHVSC